MPKVRRRVKRDSTDNTPPQQTQKEQQQQNESDSSDDELIDEEEGGMRIGGVYISPAPPAVCSSEYNGPRMIISHIVNENFKSYAGRVVLGPFHKNFTSIIGPNGSGKSNVIDSMLFVFGYRATKIRSKKISVLLHKSENHQNIRSCTVAVHFKKIIDVDDIEYEVIPNSEIVIARTAFADNSSFYTINGRRAQFKDVASVLRSHGIDLVHNRFLILQGEVEQIAMMKPKAETKHDTGMLEYLEDIIGTTRYKRPIEKLGEKVNQLYEERQAKVAKVKAAEKERDLLKEPMTEAIEFLKIENKKTYLWNSCYQRQIYDLENKLKDLEELKKIHEQKMLEIKEKLKSIHDNRVQKEKEAQVKHKEIEALRNQKENLSETFRKIDNRATQLKEEISQTNKKRKKAIETKKQDEAKIIELENLPEKNQKEIEELTIVENKLVAEREKEEAVVEEIIANLKIETKELQEVKDGLSNTLIGLKKAKDDAKAKYDMAKFELEMYLSNEQKEAAKLEKLLETLNKTSQTLKQRKMDVERLKSNISEAKQHLQTAPKELNSIRKEEPIALQELHRIRAIVNESRHSMQANRSRGRVLDFIMKQKEDGHLPGVFGRLGDLGGIDSMYDVAVSTACGPLDSIVVDTIKTGKDCVEALKRHNVGRANFIALEVQEKLRSTYQRPIKTPENVPRLFDLINVPDDRVKPAFYYALRDTLVANNMEQAIRVAYGSTRYRVVTLSGEIIELSGTMSGGGNQKMKGRMGRSVAPVADLNSSKLEAMESQANELSEKITRFHQRQAQLEDTISRVTRDIQQWEMDLKSFNFEIQGLSQQEPLLNQQVKDQEKVVKNAAPDPQTVKRMTAAVDKLKEELDKEAEAARKVEEKVADVTKKIEEVTGGKMKAAQQKLDAVTKKLDKVRAEITKLKVAINSAARNLKKTKERLQNLATEIKDAEEAIVKAEAENKELMIKGNEINTKVKCVCDEIQEYSKIVDSLRSEINNLVKEENKINTMKLHEDQTTDSSIKALHETKASIPPLKKKLAALKLNDIPGEDKDDRPGLIQLSPEELEEIDVSSLRYKITNHDETLSRMKPDLKAIQEYESKVELLRLRCQELDEVAKKRNEIKKAHDEIRKARLNEFMAGFTVISNKLKEMYQMITLGGDAEFELFDSLDPFAEGVVFSVRPPNKSWKEISNLSGGEKTLSSLALVFALHYYRPSPLYVMDEIDAALDYKNVSIVGNYIKERTKNAQFIVISLRSNMFELADVLVGIFKTDNCTKCVTITPEKYAVKERNNDDEEGPMAKQSRNN